MSFPSSHKTIFLLDHTLSSQSGVKLDLEALVKSRSGSHSSPQPHHFIPFQPVSKSIWTCTVEAITEYCRIVWDIFPGTRLIRFIAVDKTLHKLNSWSPDEQNLSSLMNHFMNLGAAKSGVKCELEKGFKAALEALVEPTEIQHDKRSSFSAASSKVLNKGRIVIISKIRTEEELKRIKEKYLDILIKVNKAAAATDIQMPINHCDLVLINFCREHETITIPNQLHLHYSTFLSFEFCNLHCGASLAPKLCNLVLKHYDLASTTVTGIPMKEEQNASSSANYDVELFHPASAHTAILQGAPSETAHLKTVREGTDYETVTLKWCTPRSNANIELQHCSSAYRITSVDVNSRPSSCLTNFLLNGRWVMLEMPRKSGSKVISHMLACHGGDIYIHTMYTSRSILEDPPSISEGCGGRVTDYRIPVFGDLMRANMLAPFPHSIVDEKPPLDLSKELLSRHTKYWPITLSATCIFNLGAQIEPLTRLMVKESLNEDEIVECKNVIYALMNMESRQESLPPSASGQRGKGAKRDEQYKALWAELELYLKNYLLSSSHESVLECLLECQNKTSSSSEFKSEEKVDINQAHMEIDNYNSLTEREKAEFNQTKNPAPKHAPYDLSIPDAKKKKTSHNSSLIGGRNRGGMNLLSMWESKISSEQSQRCPEFAGRLKAIDNITPLYPNLNKDKEKEEAPRRSKPS